MIMPNFILLDTTMPDVARLVVAMLQARDAVDQRSWSRAKNGGPMCLQTLAPESESDAPT